MQCCCHGLEVRARGLGLELEDKDKDLKIGPEAPIEQQHCTRYIIT